MEDEKSTNCDSLSENTDNEPIVPELQGKSNLRSDSWERPLDRMVILEEDDEYEDEPIPARTKPQATGDKQNE